MKKILHLIPVCLTAIALSASALAAGQKPNILFIVADDLGWRDVGFHGSDIRTPNLDKLAAGGTRLEQFYAQPMCTPTRAALMTGRYPLRYGLQTGVIPTGGAYGIPTDEWLLPQALREAGYTTAIIGKWHLGHADKKYWPNQRGFDHQYGPLIGEIDYFTHECEGKVDWYRNNKLLKQKGYSTTLFGNDAVKFISEQSPARPFYLYLAFNAPHTPYQAPQEYLDTYKNIPDPNRRAYAAAITVMDEQIGRVLATLDQKRLRDNTLIVFMSDNGGTRNAMFAGAMADVSKAKIPCDNGPYREGKGMNYEGGTRVVSLVNWPGHVASGAAVNEMIHAVDWYPTLAALAGASTAKCKPLDGLDVWPAISEGKPSPRSEIVYNVEPFRAAVRQGEWKLVWRAILPASIELYNIPQDPSEKNNLAAQYPDKVAALQRRANELAAQAAKPALLELGFKELMHQFHLPPAFPDEEFEFIQER
ncbi:MAG TPA: arylsulfatase [Candidatus Paceibacterota bacterium]|nr:arylsulfatase [Candidatus Paceibacterota bacterium]HSA02646.1 arylsulfatase [Candidatus Paceibacterota bacterium]